MLQAMLLHDHSYFTYHELAVVRKKSIKKKKHMIKVLLKKKLPFTTHCVVRETYCVYCEAFHQYDTITVTLLCFERHFGALVPSETASFNL